MRGRRQWKCGEDKGAGNCDELEEVAADGLSPLGEAEVVGVRRVERFEIKLPRAW